MVVYFFVLSHNISIIYILYLGFTSMS